MKLQKIGFSRIERLANVFGLYRTYHTLIEKKILKPERAPDLYRYSVTSYLMKYFDGYLGHGAMTENGNLGFGFIHASFINSLKPERVLCVGSKKGYIPAICALACKYLHHGRVDFVDAGYNEGEENNWGGIGFWKTHDPKKHFSVLDIHKYLTTHVMTSRAFARAYPQRKYGYIYIDGDHTYEGAKKDYTLFWPRLSHGGFMAFHDINTKGSYHDSEFGVWRFWQELQSNKKIEFVDGVNAIGIVQK